MTPLPNVFTLPDMCHFFEKVSYYHPSFKEDLLFLVTRTSAASFTQPVPVYTPSPPNYTLSVSPIPQLIESFSIYE